MLRNCGSYLWKGQQTIKIVTGHLLWNLKVKTKCWAAFELFSSTLSNQETGPLIPPYSLNPRGLTRMSHNTHQRPCTTLNMFYNLKVCACVCMWGWKGGGHMNTFALIVWAGVWTPRRLLLRGWNFEGTTFEAACGCRPYFLLASKPTYCMEKSCYLAQLSFITNILHTHGWGGGGYSRQLLVRSHPPLMTAVFAVTRPVRLGDYNHLLCFVFVVLWERTSVLSALSPMWSRSVRVGSFGVVPNHWKRINIDVKNRFARPPRQARVLKLRWRSKFIAVSGKGASEWLTVAC